jgi:hypothetical protein
MTDTDVQRAAEMFTKRLIKDYASTIDKAYELAQDQSEFDEMQRLTFEGFRDMLISKVGFTQLAAANFCRFLVHLYQPKDSPYTPKDLKTMENIVKSELQTA